MDDIEGRCMKCKKQVIISQGVGKTTSNNLFYVVGVCPDCGTKVSRIIGKAKKENASDDGGDDLE